MSRVLITSNDYVLVLERRIFSRMEPTLWLEITVSRCTRSLKHLQPRISSTVVHVINAVITLRKLEAVNTMDNV